MTFSVVLAGLLHNAVPAPALSFLQAGMKRLHTDLSPEKAPFNPGAVSLEEFEAAAQSHPVKFYLYDLEKFEPRFDGEQMSNCERPGADYMFIKNLRDSENRVFIPSEAEVKVVPCLFESFRRCAKYDKQQENVPFNKAFDDETKTCLEQVMATSTFSATNGTDHVWVVADQLISHGLAARSELFKQMSIGRSEIVNQETSEITHRPTAVEQSRCSFVVPYASDVAYHEQWKQVPSYREWRARNNTIHFRSDNREYVLSCGEQPCEGATDATPLRNKSLELADQFGDAALVKMEFAQKDQYIDELHNSKFCLVMRGDTPSSHAYYDALAANCVPVLVSDDWDEVSGPFSQGKQGTLQGGLKHQAYTLRVSEDMFMDNLPAVASRIQKLLADPEHAEAIFDNMQKHRSALLWSMPDNQVSEFALQSARRCVKSKLD
jgi:hypothetical protein